MIVEQYQKNAGFSLIELITVIVLLGILSVFALGRLSSPDQFALKGFFDDTVNAVRFAQKLAVSSGCNVQANMTTAGYEIRTSTTCGEDEFTFNEVIDNPANRAKLYDNLNTGFNIAPATPIVFSARGVLVFQPPPDPGTNTDITYTISGGGAAPYTFTVFGQTGLVNVP